MWQKSATVGPRGYKLKYFKLFFLKERNIKMMTLFILPKVLMIHFLMTCKTQFILL